MWEQLETFDNEERRIELDKLLDADRLRALGVEVGAKTARVITKFRTLDDSDIESSYKGVLSQMAQHWTHIRTCIRYVHLLRRIRD